MRQSEIVVNCLKQYIAKCPVEEKLSQDKLISLFLEGLKDKDVLQASIRKKA